MSSVMAAELEVSHLQLGARSLFGLGVSQALHVRSRQVARERGINLPASVEGLLSCPTCGVLWVPGMTLSVRATSGLNRKMRRMQKYLELKKSVRHSQTKQLRYICLNCPTYVIDELPKDAMSPTVRESSTVARTSISHTGEPTPSKKRSKARKQSSLKELVANSKGSKQKLFQGRLNLSDFML
jgi:hypothetical protein